MVVYRPGLKNYARYMMLLSYKNMVEGQGSITVKKSFKKGKVYLRVI